MTLNLTVLEAAQMSTPTTKTSHHVYKIPDNIKTMIKERRNIRRQWQQNRHPDTKRKLNEITKKIKVEINDYENLKVNRELSELTGTAKTNYSLWKATRTIKTQIPHQPPLKTPNGSWAKTDDKKAAALADYYEKTFKTDTLQYDPDILNPRNTYKTQTKDTLTTIKEVKTLIKEMKDKKTQGLVTSVRKS